MKGGAIEFLTKPFREQELIDAVQLGLARDLAERDEEQKLSTLKDRFATRCKMFSTPLRVGVGAALVVLGLSVMYGWIFGVGILTSVLPGWPNMKFNPALCFVLLGLAFILIQRPSAPARIGPVICGVAIATIAGATMAEYLSGRDLGIDQFVVADRVTYSGSGLPGRMSPASALAFVLEGIAVILLSVARHGSSVRIAHAIAVCAGVSTFFTAAGYAFGAEALGHLGLYKLMAVHTAIAHTAACIAIVATRAQESWLAGYKQAPVARTALLRFLPVSVGLPAGIGLSLLLGAGLGLYSAELALSLFGPLMAVLLIALGVRAGQHARDGEVALRASQAQLEERASLLELSHDAVFSLDLGAVISTWNRAAEELYGWPSEEAIGRNVHDLLETTFPEPIEDIYATLHRTGRWEGELLHRKRDGTKVMAASRWSLHHDRQGQPVAILETNNDITERKRAEESLQQAQSDLARFNRVSLMGEMTASISHEINQPISGAITNANAALHWLAAEPPNVEEVRKSLERIVKDGHRASDVIGRVRALARKTPPHKDPLDINEAIGEVLALAERELQSNSVKVSVRLSRKLPLVPADRIQVQQVVLNLVVNAIEAMSGTSERHRQLSVSTGPDSSDVFVEIRDCGAGLQAADRERLFHSFYTTKEGGMGMGLSLSRAIVEAHGGRLSAAPNEPNGAIFRFTLPVVDPSTADRDA